MTGLVRIDDLAEEYGISSRDLASELRELGMSMARSHMSALDPFEMVPAQGLQYSGMPCGYHSTRTQ